MIEAVALYATLAVYWFIFIRVNWDSTPGGGSL